LLPPIPTEGPLTGGSEVRFDQLTPPSDAAGFYQKDSNDDDEIPLGTATNIGGEQSSILDALINDPPSFPKPTLTPPPTPAANRDIDSPNDRNVTMPQFELPDLDLPDFPQSSVPSSEKTVEIQSLYPAQWMSPEDKLSSEELDLPENFGTAEDAVDLTSETNIPMPSLTDSGTFEIPKETVDADDRRRHFLESSAVDLNPKAGFTGEFDAITPGSTPMLRPQQDDYEYADVIDSDEDVVVPEPQSRRRPPAEFTPKKRSPLAVIGAGVLGLALGAGGFAGAWLGGVLPEQEGQTKVVPGPDNSEALAQAKADAESAKTKLAEAEARVTKANEDANKIQGDLTKAQGDLTKAQTAETDAKKKLTDAQTAETKAKEDLATAKKEATDASEALKVAEKKLEDAVKGVETALKDAGGDPTKPAEAIAKLATAKKDAETKQKELTDKLDVAAKKETDLQKAVDDAKKVAVDVMKAKDDVESVVKGISDKLEKAKFLTGKADPTTIAKALDDAIKAGSTDAVKDLRAEIVGLKESEAKAKELAIAEKKKADDEKKKAADATALANRTDAELILAKAQLLTNKEDIAKLTNTIKELKDAQGNLKAPEQVFDAYLVALADPSQKALAEEAKKDVTKVLGGKPTPAIAIKAQAVAVLAMRNMGDLAGATTLLESIKGQLPDDADWAKPVLALAKKSADPLAIIKPVEPTTPPNELTLLDGALKAFPADSKPKEHAKLLARRAELTLGTNPTEAAKDVAAALKLSPSVEAFSVAGQLAENSGKLDDAIRAYEDALKLGGNPEIEKKVRLNLLNAKRKKFTSTPAEKTSFLHPKGDPQILAILMFTLLEPGEVPKEYQALLDDADKLIAEKEYLGHIVKADVLAKLGRHSEALKEYSEGLKKLKVLPKDYEGILDNIVKSHPGLRSPGQEGKPDVETADKHYGEGLTAYHNHKYTLAIENFEKAIKASDTDARYRYFLALALSAKGKKSEAEVEFMRGRELELLNKPTYRSISNSLIRVQGPTRNELNKYRP